MPRIPLNSRCQGAEITGVCHLTGIKLIFRAGEEGSDRELGAVTGVFALCLPFCTLTAVLSSVCCNLLREIALLGLSRNHVERSRTGGSFTRVAHCHAEAGDMVRHTIPTAKIRQGRWRPHFPRAVIFHCHG